MPVLSKPQELFLTNGGIIGRRYLKKISTIIRDFGVRSPRFMIIGLYDVDSEKFSELLDFGDGKLRAAVANLNEVQGNRILEAAREYLERKYETKREALVPDIVEAVAYLGGPDSITGQFVKAHFRQQRIYLQSICDGMEMIAAIKLMNEKLVANPKVAYDEVLDVWDQIIHPGRLIIRAAYIIRNLMSLENLDHDMDHADEVLGHNDEMNYLMMLENE